MNGLTRPSVGAGGLGVLAAGIEEVVAGGGLAGIGAGGLAGAEEGAAAGAAAGVCANAPETRRGSPKSAPMIQTRSVMHQDPTWRRASCAPATIHYAH